VAYISRRYQDVNGNPVDFASDDALNVLSEIGSIQIIDSQFNQFKNPCLGSLIGIDLRIHSVSASYQQYLCEMRVVIANAERKYFGVNDPHLQSVISYIYRSHLAERRIWGEILDRSRPHLAFMTQNGMQKGLILEAKRRNVPVIEFQHGVIHSMHLAYSYPQSLGPAGTAILPDALLLFSEFWKKKCCMPGTKLVVVGNNRFSNDGVRSTRSGAAVFVTAGPFQMYLSPLAVEIARSMPNRSFIMKLHPSFLSDRASIEKEYRGIENLTVVGAEKNLPELMSDASDVIIVESTGAYEALDWGVPVHILKKAGYMLHKDLFLRPDVCVFETAKELRNALFMPMNRPDGISRFFDEFNPIAFKEFIQSIRNEPVASI
jgi:hypothetical protein